MAGTETGATIPGCVCGAALRCAGATCHLGSGDRTGRQSPDGTQLTETFGRERSDVKVRPSVKPMCEKCKIIRRRGRVLVICSNPRPTQLQCFGCGSPES